MPGEGEAQHQGKQINTYCQGTEHHREEGLKTSRESRKAALRISHLLSRCQVVFTKRGTITTTVTTATITTITI